MKRLLPLALLALAAIPAHAQTGYERLASRTTTPGYPAERVRPSAANIQIVTRDGKLALLLTNDALTMQLTDRAIRQAEQEMEGDPAAENGQGEFESVIAAAARGTVHESLRRGYQVRLRDIRSIRWEDAGRLVITDVGGHEILAGVQSDGRPVLESFVPDHAREFVREFNRLKHRTS